MPTSRLAGLGLPSPSTPFRYGANSRSPPASVPKCVGNLCSNELAAIRAEFISFDQDEIQRSLSAREYILQTKTARLRGAQLLNWRLYSVQLLSKCGTQFKSEIILHSTAVSILYSGCSGGFVLKINKRRLALTVADWVYGVTGKGPLSYRCPCCGSTFAQRKAQCCPQCDIPLHLDGEFLTADSCYLYLSKEKKWVWFESGVARPWEVGLKRRPKNYKSDYYPWLEQFRPDS